MKEDFQIGGNRPHSKKTVEVDNVILSVSENKVELVSLDGQKGGFGISSCSEQVSRFLFGRSQEQILSKTGCFNSDKNDGVELFLSEMNYCISSTEFKRIGVLHDEYMHFCKKNDLVVISELELLESLYDKGYKRIVYTDRVGCKKGSEV